MIFVFVNCSLFHFINWIISGLKKYETRNRNTLKQLIGKKVYLVETGKHKKPLVRCSCLIAEGFTVGNIYEYEQFRPETMVKAGTVYDFIPGKKKTFYKLEKVQSVPAFPLPDNIIRHGRTWAELIE